MKTAYRWLGMCVAAGVVMGGMAAGGQEGAGAGMPPRGGMVSERGDMAPGGGKGMHGKKAGAVREPVMNEAVMVEQILNQSELTTALGVTDEQIATLQKAAGELKTQQKALLLEREKAGLEQARLMLETNINEEAVMATVEKAGKAQTDLAKLQVKQLLLVRKTLTTEQIEHMKDLMRQRARKVQEEFEKEMRGMGGHDPKGPKRPDRGPGGRGTGPNAPAISPPNLPPPAAKQP